MSFHRQMTGTDIHVPHAFTYANESARTGATGFGTEDLYKFAVQTDDNSLWTLTATTPTWAEVSAHSYTSQSIYDSDGTLTGNRTVTGNSGDNLSFLHYNGTSSTYTLRSALVLEDDDITMAAHLGDGFGSDIASSTIVMANTGLSITSGIGDTEVFQSGNEWIFYEGANDSSTNLMTLHGGGDHSSFDPYITLHEGFATGNGTNAQDLVVNFGKGNLVKFNDGTRSVTTLSIKSVVNGAQTFTHMEHNYEGVQQDFLNIRALNWYMDTTGSPQWSVYDDDAGSNEIFRLTPNGYLGAIERLGIGRDVPAFTLDLLGTGSEDIEIRVDASGDFEAILNLQSENSWEFRSYHFEASTANQGQLEIANDTASQVYLTFSDADSEIVVDPAIDLLTQGGVIVPTFPSQIEGATTNVTVTTTYVTIALDSATIDQSGSEYTINLGSNQVEFDTGDGSKIYEVIWHANFLLENQGSGGATRSSARIKAQLDGVDVTGSEEWCYIREYQGGTNGFADSGTSGSFLIQPAVDDVLTFLVAGETEDGQTLTDFELDGITIIIKRIL